VVIVGDKVLVVGRGRVGGEIETAVEVRAVRVVHEGKREEEGEVVDLIETRIRKKYIYIYMSFSWLTGKMNGTTRRGDAWTKRSSGWLEMTEMGEGL